MRTLLRYLHKKISDAATKKLLTYLWYHTEDALGLVFFDERISTEIKCSMVVVLDQEPPDRTQRRSLVLDPMFLSDSNELEHLVTKNIRGFFSKLQLPEGFLLLHHPS